MYIINLIIGLFEFFYFKFIFVVVLKEVVDKGYFYDDGMFYDFFVELYGRDRSKLGNSLFVFDFVIGEIVVFFDIGINGDLSYKIGDLIEICVVWLMVRKRV